MSTPKWLFFVLVFWVLATLWCNALEPATPSLLSSSMSSSIQSMNDPSLASASGGTKIMDWIGNIWKALSFDYGIFEGWLAIVRIICVLFTIGSLYLIADLIIMIWRVIWAVLGKFA